MVFSLNEESGEISMNGRVPAGVYSINVNVYDAVWKLNAESTVKIVIKDIDREAVLSSGSIRFQGCLYGILNVRVAKNGKIAIVSLKRCHSILVCIFTKCGPISQSMTLVSEF